MDRKKLSVLLALILTLALTLMVSCSKEYEEDIGGGDTGQDTEAVNDIESDEVSEAVERDPALDKEIEGAKIRQKKSKPEKFYGSWKASSEKAEFLYGNVDLHINEDGTWTGNVTEIDLEGKWTPSGKGINIKDTEGLIDWNLFLTTDGTMMFEDNEDPDNPVVLKPNN